MRTDTVAWRQDSGIVALLEDRWDIEGTTRSRCSSSGVYVRKDSTWTSVRLGWGRELCSESVFRGSVRGNSAGTEGVLESGGRLLRWDFLSGTLTEVHVRGVPNPTLPAWTPDDRLLVVSRQDGKGGDHVYLVNADGSGAHRFAAVPGHRIVSPAAMAPGLDRVALAVVGLPAVASGGLQESETEIIIATREEVSEAVAIGKDPAWSPTGELIAFTSLESREKQDSSWRLIVAGVHLVTPRGAATQQLVGGFLEVSGYPQGSGIPGGPLIWRPDGTQIAFVMVGPSGGVPSIVDIADGTGQVIPLARPSPVRQ